MPIHQQASTIDIIVREWICEVLRAHPSVLTIALRQRAKFEGWLKFELAAWAELQGAQDVEVEANSDYTAATRADLTFWWAGVRCDVELKTANTNYRMAGVANIHRPITKNLHGIGRDAGKLRNVTGQGVVAFVLFPVRATDEKWKNHIARIAEMAEVPISPETNCERMTLPWNGSELPSLVVCAFAVPKQVVGIPG